MIDIIGHRGASEDAPENTLAAIEEAWKQQADGVEIDVRMSSDSRLVCVHDNNLFRTTGKNCLIENTSLEEIKKLDAGSWRGKEWTNSMIPSLEEVLEKIPAGKKIFIEVKLEGEELDGRGWPASSGWPVVGGAVGIGSFPTRPNSFENNFKV